MRTRKKYILAVNDRKGEEVLKSIAGVFSSHKKAKIAMEKISESYCNDDIIHKTEDDSFIRLDYERGYVILSIEKVLEDAILPRI